jgi:hypothetical protein
MEESKATHQVAFYLDDEWVKKARIEGSEKMSEDDLDWEVEQIVEMADFFDWDRYEVVRIEEEGGE